MRPWLVQLWSYRFPTHVEFIVVTDPFDLIDQWGPEKVVLISDRRFGMRGVVLIDNTARGDRPDFDDELRHEPVAHVASTANG